ncbi:MAG TPA: hypothetical protein VKE70_33635 [Candidatus Solibacter sp.]|nr:hypothetical protein [Candidatus Solibacter sp.]
MINAADRSFHRARTALIRTQAARLGAKASPQPLDPKPETPKLGWFRQKTPHLVMTPTSPEPAVQR